MSALTSGETCGTSPRPFPRDGGCKAKHVHGRVAALCMTCGREPLGGEQMDAALRRGPDNVAVCDNWVAHGVTVRPVYGPVYPAASRPLEHTCNRTPDDGKPTCRP